MNGLVGDLPFKTADYSIVILKSLPVRWWQNGNGCLIEDGVMSRIEEILVGVVSSVKLETVQ